MIKYICIKDYFSNNLPKLKIHTVGSIYAVKILKKECELHINDGFYSFTKNLLEKHFITLGEYRENRINEILDI